MLFLTACSEEYLTDEAFLPATEQGLACLQSDCATGTNPLVLTSAPRAKSAVPLPGIQRAYLEQYSAEEHLARLQSDGYPAWDALLTVDVSEDYRHYLVPVYEATSSQVEAVISIIHYLGQGMARIDYLDRDAIDGQISYYDSVLASKFQQSLGGSKFTKEALVYIHLSLDYELFGYYDTDALNNISQEATQDFFAKDCKITIHYISETVWYTSAGGEVIDVSSTYTLTSETTISDGVGCGGTTPPGGFVGTSGTNGGGPTNGTNGPGTVVVNNDPNNPNNRCIEDGVGCDEEEEDNTKPIKIERINILIDPNDFPCASAAVNQLFGDGNDGTNPIVQLINGVFNTNSNVNLTITTHPDVATQAGRPSEIVPAAFFNSGSGTNSRGEFVFQGSILLDEDWINCTNDFIRVQVVHEAIHGYLSQQRALLGDAEFLATYPIEDFGSLNRDDHLIMSREYVDSLASVLHHYNPGLSPLTLKLLSWSGLTDTPAYADFRNNHPDFTPEQIDATLNAMANASGIECGNIGNDSLEDFNFQLCGQD
jgi:hypothetical protein